MHDFLEKTGPCVAASIIFALVNSGTITLLQYNAALTNIRLQDYERSDRPPPIKKDTKKLPGKALSIALHIRLMPYLFWQIGGESWMPGKDHEDLMKLLQLLLKLNEYIQADFMSIADVENLEDCWISYLETRKHCKEKYQTFGNLTSKDHNIEHYKEQIKKNGPLNVIWTARAESKHQEFLNIAMNAKNFINLPKTLAERSQKLLTFRLTIFFICQCIYFSQNCIISYY